MERIVQIIEQEIKVLEKKVLSLQKARELLAVDTGEPTSLKARKRRKYKSQRLPVGSLKTAILSALSDNGSMPTSKIVEAMKKSGFKFSRGIDRNSTVRSSLVRLVKAKKVGRIDTPTGVVFTTHAEVFHPKEQVTQK